MDGINVAALQNQSLGQFLENMSLSRTGSMKDMKNIAQSKPLL